MKLDNIKLIATDLDGTILSHGEISNKGDVEALIEASKQGIQVVVATGQGWSSGCVRAKMLSIDEFSDVSVFSNGAVISSISKFNPLYCETIPSDVVMGFMKKMTKHQIACLAFTKISGHAYWNSIRINVDSLIKRKWSKKYIMEPTNVELHTNYEDVVQLMIFVEAEQEEILLSWIKEEHIHLQLNKMRSNVESTPIYEFTNQKVSKGKGVLMLAEMLNISKDEVLIFGDNLNDISMFEIFPNSVAVGNAVDIIKDKAKYITDTNKNGGVGKFIKEYVLKDQNGS